VQFRTAHINKQKYLRSMAMTDRAEFRRLLLQVERDLVAQTHLKALCTNAGTIVARHRQELRTIEARITSRRRVNGRRGQR